MEFQDLLIHPDSIFYFMEKMVLKGFQLSDYEVLHTLGTGSFGRVKLARHKATGRYYALKMLKKTDVIKQKQVDHVINENQILHGISHPFMINMEGFSQDSRYLYFMLEFVAGGELFAYLRSTGALKTEQAALYAAQVVLCFSYLHEKNIVYRDLKPENILIDEHGYLKLTDFGFAKIVITRTFTLCGTPEYLAPQIVLNQGHGKPVDWWALGVFIYEMIAGIDPFTSEDPMDIYQNILKCKLKFYKEFDRNAKSLVKHLLVSDLSKRYGNLKEGVSDILTHRWFSAIDWKVLLAKKVDRIPYKPTVKKPGDTSNFVKYPDSLSIPPTVHKADDPFLEW